MNSETKLWIVLACCVGLRVYATLSRREYDYDDWDMQCKLRCEVNCALLNAIVRGDCNKVEQLFVTNDANIFDPSILRKALECGHADVLDVVLTRNRFSEAHVLHNAVDTESGYAVYVLLLKHGFLNQRTARKYLHAAVGTGNERVVALCLSATRQNEPLKAADSLISACRRHSPAIVKLLLDADIDLYTNRGSILDSVYNIRAYENTTAADCEIVRLLLEAHCGAKRLKRQLHAPSVAWALANPVLFAAFLRYGRNTIVVCRFAKQAAQSEDFRALERVLMSSDDPRLLCHIKKSVSAQCEPLLRLLHQRFETIRLVNLVLLLKPLELPVLVIYRIYKKHPMYSINSLVPRYAAWNLIKSINHRDCGGEKK